MAEKEIKETEQSMKCADQRYIDISNIVLMRKTGFYSYEYKILKEQTNERV